jgi:hypothetical protein
LIYNNIYRLKAPAIALPLAALQPIDTSYIPKFSRTLGCICPYTFQSLRRHFRCIIE